MAIFMEHITSENNKVNDLAQLKESILAAAKSAEENGRHDKLVIELENGYYCDGASSNWDVSDSVVINVDEMPIFSQPHLGSLTYHNHFRNIYSTTAPHISSHVPERDVIRSGYRMVKGGEKELLEAYPEAEAIRDAAGAKL